MKIVFVGCSTFQHGTYFRWHRLARELTLLGQEVHVVVSGLDTKPRYAEKSIDDVPYHVIARAKGGRLFGGEHFNLFSAARRLVVRVPLEPDIVHLFEPLPTVAATWLSQRSFRRATTVWDWCDLWYGGLLDPSSPRLPVRNAARCARFFERWFPRKCDWVTAITHDLVDRAKRAGASGVTYLPNGMDINPVNRQAAREAFQLRDGVTYFVFAGRSTSELKWCFEAVRRIVHTTECRVHLLLAGMPVEECERYGHDVASHWTHLGQLTADRCRQLYGACDLGLLPLSDNDFNRSRLPLKLLDMLGSGCPVLASGVGDVQTMAKELPGVISTGCSEDRFAESAKAYVVAPADATRELRDRARELTAWVWAERAKDLVDLYQSLKR